MLSYILAVITGLSVLGLDQLTKVYIAANYELAESHDFISGVLDITYIHNKGGAWGMLSGYTWLLLSVTLLVMLVCVALLLKHGLKNKLMFWAIVLVLCGGIGNMLDRVFRDGNVIDFLHFSFFPEFPVFNVADCGIVVGAGLLILYFLIGMIREDREKRRPMKEVSAPDENTEA